MRSTNRQPDHRLHTSLHSHQRQRGWTKFQLIAAIGVAIVIAAVAVPRLVSSFTHAHSSEIVTAEQDIDAIHKALQQYKESTGVFPTTEQGLLALIIKPTRSPVPKNWQTGGYIDRLPRDPWGNTYQYRLNEDGKDFELFSYGANGPDIDENSDTVIRDGRH